jgi:hypothetical protein
MVRAILIVLALGAANVCLAAPPDLAPVRCTWAQLPAQLQEKLRNSVTIDNRSKDVVLYRHGRPPAAETIKAVEACRLAFTGSQIDQLSSALGYKAREEVARMGLAARGAVKAHIVDRAVGNLDDDRRVEIGDTLACPNTTMDYRWDRSVIRAIRRTGTKTFDGPSVAFVGMAVYAIVAQEGFMRLVLGAAPNCPNG